MDVRTNETVPATRRVCPTHGWPREVVVDHGDGTVSLFANVSAIDRDREEIRARRASDQFRELMS